MRDGGGAHRAVLDELGVLRDVEAPALVLGEMPVQHVHLVRRHLVHHPLHDFLAEEVAAVVEMRAAPLERRRVHDGRARNLQLAPAGGLRHLLQRLARVERARVVGRLDGDARGRDRQLVALGGHGRVLRHDHLHVRGGRGLDDQLARRLHVGLGRGDERGNGRRGLHEADTQQHREKFFHDSRHSTINRLS